jgi:hypothetical protein
MKPTLLTCVLSALILGQTVRISARAVDARGITVCCTVPTLVSLELGDTSAPLKAMRSGGGPPAFVFEARPKKYKLTVPDGEFDISPDIVDARPGKDLDLGAIVIEPRLIRNLRVAQIVVDLRNGVDGTLAAPLDCGLPNSAAPLDSPHSPSLFDAVPKGADHRQSIEAAVGGKVTVARVTRFERAPDLTASEIQNEVRRVWLGRFEFASPWIPWSEGVGWRIEASVEFEDGTRATLLTDGLHVQVRDRDGKCWSTRIWPSA